MSTEIALSNRGVLRPTTMGEILEFAKLASRSAFVPAAFRNKPEDAFIAMQMGAELGLSPIQSLQSIAVINGRPAVFGDALLALVLASPLCIDVIEAIKGSGENQTAVCEARRRGREPVIRGFSIADAKQAKLWGKAGAWADYPMVMLKHRARGFALRDAFPDLLRGLISAEEAADTPRDPKDITPLAADLKETLDAFAPSETLAGDDDHLRRLHHPPPVVVPDVDPDQAETDTLLAAAWVHAKDGWGTFRAWYLGLEDDQRVHLRPHMTQLQATAKAPPVPAPPAPDDPAQPSASAPAATPDAEVTPARRGRPRKPPEPTDEEIERSQDMLAAVLGPEELAKLDEQSLDEIEVIKPQRLPRDAGWDWPLYADEMIAAGTHTPIAELGRFRGAQASMFDVLRNSNREQWERVNRELAEYERTGTLDDPDPPRPGAGG